MKNIELTFTWSNLQFSIIYPIDHSFTLMIFILNKEIYRYFVKNHIYVKQDCSQKLILIFYIC